MDYQNIYDRLMSKSKNAKKDIKCSTGLLFSPHNRKTSNNVRGFSIIYLF